MLGTLYPLFLDALSLPKASVGPPYFNLVFGVVMARRKKERAAPQPTTDLVAK